MATIFWNCVKTPKDATYDKFAYTYFIKKVMKKKILITANNPTAHGYWMPTSNPTKNY
ncbi:MAG: hypothetical protein WDM90_10585 [Ferruginibacter sp.]